jgi:hypothetical protein
MPNGALEILNEVSPLCIQSSQIKLSERITDTSDTEKLLSELKNKIPSSARRKSER